MPTKIERLKKGDLRKLFEAAERMGWVAPEETEFPCETDINSGDRGFFPLKENIFKAFTLVSPEKVNYVVLGMDPYPGVYADGTPLATGIAFGVTTTEKGKLPSQTAIRKVLKGIYPNDDQRQLKCSLEDWAKRRGVLLLNAALTVPRRLERGNTSDRHFGYWRRFICSIVNGLPKATHIAWGKDALAQYEAIGIPATEVISCNHPVASKGKLGGFSAFWKREEICLTEILGASLDDTKD